MADLVIGGNTYKNIDYVKILREDGTTATFYDSDRLDNRVMKASLSVVDGGAYGINAAGLGMNAPEGMEPTSVSGSAYTVRATSLEIEEPSGSEPAAVAGAAYNANATGLETNTPSGLGITSVAGGSYAIDGSLNIEEPSAAIAEEEE